MIRTLKKENVILLNIKAFSPYILKCFILAIKSIIKNKSVKISYQPTTTKMLTILRSPHKYKRAQEHFQLKIFKNTLIFKNIQLNEIFKILINKPKGIFIKYKLKQNS